MPTSQSTKQGAVVVSGASTGIGAATASHLAAKSFQVFAGVRREEDGEALTTQAPDGLTAIRLDITDPGTISGAVNTVARAVGARGLAGLVNNAGIVKPAPIEFQPLDDFREQLELNLIAHVAVTQAFLPLIRLGGGRIVNIGSIGGRLVLPIHGAYSASKFGMEALSDALRLELRQWGIHVSLVDPGATESTIFGKTLAEIDGLENRLGDDGYRLYAEQIDAVRRLVVKTAEDAAPPDAIAKAVAHALTSKKPKARYLEGHGAEAAATLARMPDGVKDRAVAKEVGLPAPGARAEASVGG